MNNIEEIIKIIEKLGDSASLDEICQSFCDDKGIVPDSNYCFYIENTLKKNSNLVRVNSANNKWELLHSSSKQYYYAENVIYYKKIRDAMLTIFGISVSSGGSFYELDKNKMYAWFPKSEKGWKNEITHDGKYITEEKEQLSPEEINIRKIIGDSLRITFLFDKKKGYYFVGVFKCISCDEHGKRTYIKVDDKFQVKKDYLYNKINNAFLNTDGKDFLLYLESRNLKPFTIQQYMNSINQISKQLINKYINQKIFTINDVNVIKDLYNKMFDSRNELYAINKKRKNTWSAALGAYIDFLNNEDTSVNILFCNIAYMKEYKGITDVDKPNNGGRYVGDTGSAGEQYNFLNRSDGYTIGFAEPGFTAGGYEKGKQRQIHIEKINEIATDKDQISNVMVIMCAKSPIINKTVIVGWYDNATVYRNVSYQTLENGEKIWQTIKCKNEDAHLISEEDRTFIIPRAATDGIGLGQSNYWYADTKEAQDFKNKVIEYIDKIR